MSHAGHHSSPGALPTLVLLVLLAAYLLSAQRPGRRGRRWSAWRTACWLAGLAMVAAASAPPLAALAHQDVRAHMAQHLLLGMFAPLCLVLAAPVTLALRTLPVATARRVVTYLRARPLRWLSHPLSALALNTGGMYLFYLTPLYALSTDSPALHLATQAHFLAAGALFAWVIAGPDPAPHRPRWPVRLAVLFVSVAAHATLAKLMYAYGWPRGVHDVAQLRAAAQLMYYGGALAELLLAVALFTIWFRAQGRASPPPTVNIRVING
jgi:putative membrane protein